MTESDAEFVERISDYLDDYSGIPKEVRTRLLSLAARGAAVLEMPTGAIADDTQVEIAGGRIVPWSVAKEIADLRSALARFGCTCVKCERPEEDRDDACYVRSILEETSNG